AVSEAHHPIFFNGVRESPGVSPSITRRLTPAAPPPPVRTAVVMKSARIPEVIKVFSPLTTYTSPSRRADERRFATSEPPLGSVIASAEIFLPERICGNTRALNSGLPARAIGGAPIEWLFRPALT